MSDLTNTINYEAYGNDILAAIPEREWKLLAALARKKEEEEDRNDLAEQFHKMWLKEKEERAQLETETAEQYKRYLHKKRVQDRNSQQYRMLQLSAEDLARREQHLDCIRQKERKSADLRAWQENRQITKLLDKAIEEDVRLQLAYERRLRMFAADDVRRRMELADAQRKAEDARQRRCAKLKDASKRAAISYALGSWETALLRHDIAAEDAMRRATFATQYAMKHARSVCMSREMEKRRLRARQLAAVTQQLRDAIRGTR